MSIDSEINQKIIYVDELRIQYTTFNSIGLQKPTEFYPTIDRNNYTLQTKSDLLQDYENYVYQDCHDIPLNNTNNLNDELSAFNSGREIGTIYHYYRKLLSALLRTYFENNDQDYLQIIYAIRCIFLISCFFDRFIKSLSAPSVEGRILMLQHKSDIETSYRRS